MRRRTRLLPVLFALTLVTGIPVQLGNPPPAAAAVTFSSTVVIQNGGRCLDVFGAQTGDNVNLIQWNCHGGTNQTFTFTPISATSDVYTVNTFAAGKCADVAGGSTADNANAVQLACNGGTSQRFRLVPVTVAGTDRTFNLQAVHSNKCLVVSAPATNGATILQLPCSTATDRVWRLPSFTTDPPPGGNFEVLPTLPTNACNNSSLPRSFGTNFPTPRDPFAFGWFNQSAIGWQGNWYPAFSYLSGSYFARGVPTTYTAGGTTLCGAMYSFGVFTFGLAAGQSPPAQSIQWTMEQGYLPALRTSFTRNNVAISITNLANRAVINGTPFVLAHTRITVTNNGTATVTVPPGASGLNLVRQTPVNDGVAPGTTRVHDFVSAIDRFGANVAYPSAATLASAAPSYDTAFGQMAAFWNGRINATAQPSLPNLQLPNTGLANPGTALTNAYKAGTAYHLMMQVGKSPFSGANNYAWLLNHDVPGELVARFSTGDFSDARNLLLIGRTSERNGFPNFGANWYWDGVWKTPWAWAIYLAKTNDTAFVSQFFNDNQTQFGPSLRTMMRTNFPAQLDTDGTMRTNFDNDSTGKWILSNYSALIGLAAYKYIATRIGQTAEATWAQGAYTSLHNALNTVIGQNQAANGFNFLPCEVHRPNSANRCNTFNDANWAQAGWSGQNQWDTMLMGGTPLSGIIGDPGQLDRMYQWGFDRLAGRVPFPSFGAFSGYSTAYNTAYSEGGLYGNSFRDLAITSYAWQIQTTTGGPNAWWEANGSGPSASNIWAGSHAGPQFGAVPYAWPIAHQQLALVRAVAAEGLTSSGTGPFTYTRPLYVGRGIPNTWIAPGQTVAVNNITSSINIDSGARSTYGVSLSTTRPGTGRVITVNLTGTLPGGPVLVQLPVFASSTVVSVTGGAYNSATRTVTLNSGATQATITLNN
ncbi:MAG TPA: RICIN domain-containing protein [Actinophytocola sp.]|uniref:RICIN domain-containing protein n=1 Tax=Actinophytocola sp. TaxID=1872138 RepID=UPI002DDCBCF4|nr:RICIN domain-containing protein [Actinophytocola sp.]HEV2783719.1 RICIN domain-containing protein [Actinophytocola sp.]